MLTVTYSPAEVAARLGCKVDKVLAWVNAKELIAINAATSSKGGKPRWRITPEALADWERSRTTQPRLAPAPRRKRIEQPVKSWF